MEDSTGSANLIIFFALLLIEMLLYGFASAIQVLNGSDVKERAENGDKKSIRIERIINQPSYYINMVQMITIILYLIMGGVVLHYFENLLAKVSQIGVLFTAVLSGFILLSIVLVFGVMAPKKIASHYSRQFVYAFIYPITVLLILIRPFTAIYDFIANVIARVFGVNTKVDDGDVTEEEIISMVNEGQEQGVLLESEVQMITNIFEFTDKDARDIMTHRSNIIGIEANTTLKEAVDFMLEEANSRYPVYLDDLDHIIGILHFRDACKLLGNEKYEDKPIKSIKHLIREAKFIPETRNIDTLFRSMQSLKTHMVIVIDEYGQTSGLVAMEDILEEIVGNILDEYDEDETFIQERGKDSYEIDGLTPLEELGESLGIDFGNEEFETLNGLLVAHLEHIPSEDDFFDMDYGGYNFKVLSVENRVIRNVLVTKLKETKENKENEEKQIKE